MSLVLAWFACAAEPLADGPLPAGAWGDGADGYGYILTVADDATGQFDNGCWGGDTGPITVVDGAIDVSFPYTLRGGAGSGTTVTATLAGTGTTEVLSVVFSTDDGSEGQDLELVFGNEFTLYECP